MASRGTRVNGKRRVILGAVFALHLLVNTSVFLSWSLAANAAGDFDPIPPAEQPLYRIDPTRYYTNAIARQKDVAEVRRLADDVAALRQSIASDPAALLWALQQNAALRVPLDRLWIHALILSDQDTDNSAISDDYDTVENGVNEKTAFLQTIVDALPDAKLADFRTREPGLAAYDSTFAEWRRARPHRLPEGQEVLLAELEKSTQEWSWLLYNQTLYGAPFGTVTAGGKTFDVRKEFDSLMHLPDRAVRAEAYARRGAAFKTQGTTFASNLLRVANAGQRAATRRYFTDALEASFFEVYLTPGQVDAVLAAFAKHADVARRFQRANARYVSKAVGLSNVAPWDTDAQIPGVPVPRLTIAKASDAIRGATAVFGPTYRAQLDGILDPHNGRIDLVGGRGERTKPARCFRSAEILFSSWRSTPATSLTP